METVLSREQMVAAERAAIEGGTPSAELMRRAASGLYAAYGYDGHTAIVVGSGNNGGDGYALSLLLKEAGKAVTVYAVGAPKTDDAKLYAERAAEAGVAIAPFSADVTFDGHDTVVDCLLGTGAKGAPRGEVAEAIEAINASGAYIIACDVNSGLDADSGLAAGACVRSDLTVAIGATKPGHVLGQAKDYIAARALAPLDIVLPCGARRLEHGDVAALFPPRKQFAHKGSFGKALIMAGSTPYSGAAKLAGMAFSALRTGAGMATLAVPNSIISATLPYVLEVILHPMPQKEGFLKFDEEALGNVLKGHTSIALGMGMGKTPDTAKIVDWMIANARVPMVLDADALNVLEGRAEVLQGAHAPVTLTPHPAELSRLTGIPVSEILSDPVSAARRCAAVAGATVLLKGTATVVTDGTQTYLVDRGSVGQAAAGSGDVLSGVLAAMNGWCGTGARVAAAAAYVAGLAGEKAAAKRGVYAASARDTVEQIAEALQEIIEEQIKSI